MAESSPSDDLQAHAVPLLAGLVRRMEEKIYDQAEFKKALAWVKKNCKEGVDCSAVKIDRAAPTAIYFVTHTEQGHAFHFYRAGSAASTCS